MASYTALQLVNRVRLFRRQPEVTSLSTDEDTATLNALNAAIEDILGTRRYDFDLRHDGLLVTRPPKTVDSVQVFAGLNTAVITNSTSLAPVELGALGSVVRIIPDEDDKYSNTAFRVYSYSGPPSTTTTVALATTMGEAETWTNPRLIYSEYLLPDTVREVVRASYQEDELNVPLLSATAQFDEWIPNSGIDDGEPEVMAVGGFDEQTFDSTGAGVAPQLRAIVWPLPDDEYYLNYSYYYRHPELASATDVLEGVPAEVVHDIVYQATSIMGMAWDQNFAMAHFGDMAQMGASAKQRALAGGANGRHRIHAHGRRDAGTYVELGFPNKVIGE